MTSNYWMSNAKQNIDGYIKHVEADSVSACFGDPQGLHAYANVLNGAGLRNSAKALHSVAESQDKTAKLTVLHLVKSELTKYR